MAPRHLEQRAHDLRLRVPEKEDLDLVLGVTKPTRELDEDPLGDRRRALDDRANRGLVEGEHDPIGQRDGRRDADRTVEDRALAEEIARVEHGEAPLDHPHALEEANLPLVHEVGVACRLTLAEQDVSLDERPAVDRDEMARRSLELTLDFGHGIVAESALVVAKRFTHHARTIGDRRRSPQFLGEAPESWSNRPVRRGREQRTTKETAITVEIDLDGSGKTQIETPIPFLSHMLDQIGRHGLFDLDVHAEGDIEIDGHHTTEDVGIVLGRAVANALGDKATIARYGWATLPMDEARATCAIDLSGRQFLVWEVPMPKAKIGTWDTELAEVFFEAFARGAACNLHVVLHAGQNLHHITEICFKAFAKALRAAATIEPRNGGIPSTKGSL